MENYKKMVLKKQFKTSTTPLHTNIQKRHLKQKSSEGDLFWKLPVSTLPNNTSAVKTAWKFIGKNHIFIRPLFSKCMLLFRSHARVKNDSDDNVTVGDDNDILLYSNHFNLTCCIRFPGPL